jgi:hypothetical protein
MRRNPAPGAKSPDRRLQSELHSGVGIEGDGGPAKGPRQRSGEARVRVSRRVQKLAFAVMVPRYLRPTGRWRLGRVAADRREL